MEFSILAQVLALTVTVFTLLGVVSAIEAVMKTRTAQGAVAWVIVLLTFPYIAVPVYWIFGRTKFDGYVEQRKAVEEALKSTQQATSDAIWPNSVETDDLCNTFRTLLPLARTAVTVGNDVRLLVNGEATHTALLNAIHGAQQHVYLVYYIIRDDQIGAELINALIVKAQQGLPVHVIYDEIGSRTFARSPLLSRALSHGVNIVPFNTTRGRRNRFQLNFRNHRKLACIDSRLALLGGHNVGREYLGQDPKIGPWRDTHLQIQGPAVLAMELTFAADWRWAKGEQLQLSFTKPSESRHGKQVLIFPSDPSSEFEEAGLMYHQLISEAKQRLWITSPYFIPDHSIISALQLAVLRGVDVRVMIPDNPDGPMVAMANWSYTKELLPAGVKVFRYGPGFMHQKVTLVDNDLCAIGTANFDNRSFKLAFEITALINDEEFALEVQQMLEADFASALEVSAQHFSHRPYWFRPAMALARLFSPVL
ncbi:cardiolipin synthase [Aequoribacter sp.]|uniref:cardiolipin synthase n=1 Tax=Aequoribacter sp. TaxID=2847771 RepID=UPI003F698B42